MARTINILSDGNALRKFSSSGGASIGITSVESEWNCSNATLALSSDDFVVDSRYSLRIFPSSLSPVVLELENVPLNIADNGRALSFNMKIKAASPIHVSALLFIDSEPGEYSPVETTLTSGLYNAVHTNSVSVPDDGELHTATIRLTISNHSAVNIFATLPHLIHELAFYENPFVGRMRGYLPDFYFEIDALQSQPSSPFFRLIDILTSAAGEVALEHDRMYGIEQQQLDTPQETMEYWAQSTLVSIRSVRDAYLPWLAQFTGAPVRQNIEAADGSLFFSNEGIRRDFIEWQLRYSYYGRAAGTREAIAEAAKQLLLYTKDGTPSTFSVSVTPRYLGDPFLIKVQTLTNETPDADTGEESYLVLQSINWAKPMGYKIIHETVDEFYFSFDDPSLGILDSMRFG